MFSKVKINLGGLEIGGDSPVSIQTMTNTKTEDIRGTIDQIRLAADAGCDIIRVSCPTIESTKALKEIIKESPLPVIADIHFNYKRAIESIEAGACCVRINPGNTPLNGIREIVKAAKDNGSSIRLGINSGSLSQHLLEKYKEPSVDAIIESAVENCKILEDMDFKNFKVSVKSSDVKDTIQAYRKLSKLIDYPLHIGVTEAGPVFSGTIKSAIGIGLLLADGIGDTIRVSLSTSDITEEIKVGKQILKSLNLLKNTVNVISCPTCSRTNINVVQIASQLDDYTRYMNKSLKITVLGCVVNGIGEAKHADIGIFGFKPGIAKIYFKGTEYMTLSDHEVMSVVKDLIDNI